MPCSNLTSTQVNRRDSYPSKFIIDRDPYTAVKMAAAIKALNARIRANPYTDYLFSTRKRDHHRILKEHGIGDT